MATQPPPLTEEQIRRALYQGIVDKHLRAFYETEAGAEYLNALAQLRALDRAAAQKPADEPATS